MALPACAQHGPKPGPWQKAKTPRGAAVISAAAASNDRSTGVTCLPTLTQATPQIDSVYVICGPVRFGGLPGFGARMRKPSVLVVFLTVFIDLIGFGIVLPLLPIYTRNLGAKGFIIGAIMASFSAMQFL